MLQRMLIDKMENRILVGVTMFVGIMVLVGWVSINENARMASFERQYEARAIERGAKLFATNCSTCHGISGYGIGGKAPALNSPHFFGYDYFSEIDSQVAALDDEEAELNVELAAMREELVAEGTTEERITELEERRTEISERMNGEESIASERAKLLAEKDALIASLQPAIDKGYPISDDFNENGEQITVVEPSRLNQIQWAGTPFDFIFTTLVHGRPTSISYWTDESQMQAWSQQAGGPLRDDELEDLVTYILNWDKGNDWTLEDALVVNQYAIVPGLGGDGEAVELQPPAGSDVATIVERIASSEVIGDPVRGEAIYTGTELNGRGNRLGCSGCHLGGVAAPDTSMQWDNILSERLELSQFEGYSPEQYIVESIVDPGAYVVSGYVSGAMPGNYSTDTSVQDLADIIAYIHSFSEADPPQ